MFKSEPVTKGINAYSDSDWAGCIDTRHSTTGIIIMANDSPIGWKSKRQSIVALSSAEAEYIAISTTARELCWYRRLAWEVLNQRPIRNDSRLPTVPFHVDNTAAISIALHRGFTARTKHIDTKYHFIRDCVQRGYITLHHIRSEYQLADPFTKPTDRNTFTTLTMLFMSYNSYDDQTSERN